MLIRWDEGAERTSSPPPLYGNATFVRSGPRENSSSRCGVVCFVSAVPTNCFGCRLLWGQLSVLRSPTAG